MVVGLKYLKLAAKHSRKVEFSLKNICPGGRGSQNPRYNVVAMCNILLARQNLREEIDEEPNKVVPCAEGAADPVRI